MRCVNIEIPYSAARIPRLIVFSCLHFGHKYVDMKLIARLKLELAKPDTYWIDLGDSCEFINTKDKRFDPRTVADWITKDDMIDLPRAQINFYAKQFHDLAPTCIARLAGNHEDAMSRRNDRNVYAELNEAIELPEERALGYSGIVDLLLTRGNRNNYRQRLFISHGHVGGRLPGGKANDLNMAIRTVEDVDAVFKGHGHTPVVIKPRVLSKIQGTDRLTDNEVVTACCGTFKRGELEGYEERSGFQPHGLGWLIYTMNPRIGESTLSIPVFGRSMGYKVK